MLKDVDNPTEHDWLSASEKINAFLKQDIPRKIPRELKNYCFSMTRSFNISFSIYGVVVLLIMSLLVYFRINLFRHSLLIIFIILFGPVLLFLLYSLIEHIQRLRVIKNGRLYNASIVDIKKVYVAQFQVPVYKLKLEVNINGNTITCHSYVRDEVISHFYDIMNTGDNNHIEVLCNGSKEVMIPLNLAYMVIVLKMSSPYSFTS